MGRAVALLLLGDVLLALLLQLRLADGPPAHGGAQHVCGDAPLGAHDGNADADEPVDGHLAALARVRLEQVVAAAAHGHQRRGRGLGGEPAHALRVLAHDGEALLEARQPAVAQGVGAREVRRQHRVRPRQVGRRMLVQVRAGARDGVGEEPQGRARVGVFAGVAEGGADGGDGVGDDGVGLEVLSGVSG